MSQTDMFKLDGRVVMVLGGSGGIATCEIKTGDRLRVDDTDGLVEILWREEWVLGESDTCYG